MWTGRRLLGCCLGCSLVGMAGMVWSPQTKLTEQAVHSPCRPTTEGPSAPRVRTRSYAAPPASEARIPSGRAAGSDSLAPSPAPPASAASSSRRAGGSMQQQAAAPAAPPALAAGASGAAPRGPGASQPGDRTARVRSGDGWVQGSA